MRHSKISIPIGVDKNRITISPQIDDKIKPVLVELNSKGYITRYSCEGHKKEVGYIAFDGVLNMKELRDAISICRKHKLQIISATQPIWKYGVTDIRFKGI